MWPSSARARRSRGGSDEGYILLEVLAAFAVFVLFLSALLPALAGAMRTDRQADFLLRGTTLARAKLAAAGAEYALVPGATSPTAEGGLVWQARISPMPQAEGGPDATLRAYRVDVLVSEPPRRGSRSLTLSAVALQSVQPR